MIIINSESYKKICTRMENGLFAASTGQNVQVLDGNVQDDMCCIDKTKLNGYLEFYQLKQYRNKPTLGMHDGSANF